MIVDVCGPSLTPGNHYFQTQSATGRRLLSLNIFLDPQSIIRIGCRLSHGQTLTLDQKHPMLLPSRHIVTRLLIRSFHERHFRTGPLLVLFLLRQKYWFVNARSIVRQEIHKCTVCKRLKSQPCQQAMGNLPSDKITPSRPFLKVGMDFAGPFLTKPNPPRRKVRLKSYICVVVCMCTKAVHLEVVSDLSSRALLAALRCFISRRLSGNIWPANSSGGISFHPILLISGEFGRWQ
ncbi:hypothetical protein AVEN_130257-1 [Araneus ventricosus]|uniref:Uncharacterized protein n=1 Tax=Araneus ventricosus TaxID=182803 RepID=A0A4Y2FRW5_ARAVE|nr:hypothetical protein AVEN_130257-1 [Araneus ventricosus]